MKLDVNNQVEVTPENLDEVMASLDDEGYEVDASDYSGEDGIQFSYRPVGGLWASVSFGDKVPSIIGAD